MAAETPDGCQEAEADFAVLQRWSAGRATACDEPIPNIVESRTVVDGKAADVFADGRTTAADATGPKTGKVPHPSLRDRHASLILNDALYSLSRTLIKLCRQYGHDELLQGALVGG